MKSRQVLGRRIVRVNQQRFFDVSTNTVEYALQSIWLDNGARIVFSAGDDGYELFVTAFVAKDKVDTRT